MLLDFVSFEFVRNVSLFPGRSGEARPATEAELVTFDWLRAAPWSRGVV